MRYLYSVWKKNIALIFILLHFSNNIVYYQCIFAKKEASLRIRLRFAILISKLDEDGLYVCTIYLRTEEVRLPGPYLNNRKSL